MKTDSKYITPAEVWKQLDDLRPFSESENNLIIRNLANKAYYLPEAVVCYAEDNEITNSELPNLIEFIKNAHENNNSLSFKIVYDSDVEGNVMEFYCHINQEAFDQKEAQKLRSDILNIRKRAQKDTEKKTAKEKIETKIRALTQKWSMNEISLEDFTEAVVLARRELERL